MGINLKAFVSSLFVLVVVFGAGKASAGQYYFFVTNETESTLTDLAASEDGENWGRFDIGAGIAPGETIKLVWDPSTDGQSCEQFLAAGFEDGTESETEVFDFCADMDDPIVFE